MSDTNTDNTRYYPECTCIPGTGYRDPHCDVHGDNASPQFPFGNTYITPGARDELERLGIEPISLLVRHGSKDWGDLCDEDKRTNEQALIHGARVLSAYLIEGVKFYVITEADRSSTTILLADEY